MSSQQANHLLLKKLGKRIRDLRKRHNFSQYQMAKKCAMDYGSYSKIKNGKRNVTIFTLQRITKVLKISFHELFNF